MIKIVIILSLAFTLASSDICDQYVSGSFGSVTSPGYLIEPYSNNLDCYYSIKTTTNTAVTLNIVDMDLDNGDFVDIYDGYANCSEILGRYTGNKTSYVYASTNEVLVHFHTDGYVQGKGFYIYFMERGDQINCPAINYMANYGFITSPQYPETYPSHADCYYSIDLHDQKAQVTLHAIYFYVLKLVCPTSPTTENSKNMTYQIENSTDCSKDYVEIFDGPKTSSTLLAKLCGTEPGYDIISTTNQVFIHFHSDSDGEGLGFCLSFNANACPEAIEYDGNVGTILSPGYPLYNYSSAGNCKYVVTTAIGSKVHLIVNYLNLTQGDMCASAYVNIYDGMNDTSPILANLCGVKDYYHVQASTNTILIVFYSDGSRTFPGFSITYIAKFGG